MILPWFVKIFFAMKAIIKTNKNYIILAIDDSADIWFQKTA